MNEDGGTGTILAAITPLIERIVSRYSHSEGSVSREDAEDVIATVQLRLLMRLRSDEPVESVEDYAATLTYNTLSDHLRRRYPQRTKLRNRLRYMLTHDRRLALSQGPAGMVAGLSGQAGLPALHGAQPADEVFEILRASGGVMPFDALVELTATLWNITDAPPVAIEQVETAAQPRDRELNELLAELWREIGALPLAQRKALLLNLRHDENANVIELFALTGTATFRELAAAMEMTADALAAIWNELPLPDNRIAEMLGVSRQQVINLRKSARKRLTNRVLERKGER